MKRSTNIRLDFSEQQMMILESAKTFCRDNSSNAQVRNLLHTKHSAEHTGFNSQLWQSSIDLGWMGLAVPEQYGGSDIGVGSAVCIAEAMGRFLLSTPFLSSTLAAQVILRAGTEHQKDLWLPQIAAGLVVALALLDDEDWGASEFNCTATKRGEYWLLSGHKLLVSDATAAQAFIVAIQTPDGEQGLAIVSAEQLSKDAIMPHVLLDETKRAAQVDFNDVKLDSAAMLIFEKTSSCLRDVMLIGAMLTAAEAAGSTAASLETTVEYLKTRKQFGKLIGSYQALKHPMVEILCDMDSAKSLVYHAASLVDSEHLSKDAEIACRMAKVKATEALLYAGDRGIQFHGAMGFTYECNAQLYIRRAQWSQQQFGDAAFHRKRLSELLLD